MDTNKIGIEARYFYEEVQRMPTKNLEDIIKLFFNYYIKDDSNRPAFAIFGIEKNGKVIPFLSYSAEYYVKEGENFTPVGKNLPLLLKEPPENATINIYKGKGRDITLIYVQETNHTIGLLYYLTHIMKRIDKKEAFVIAKPKENTIVVFKVLYLGNKDGRDYIGIIPKIDVYFKIEDNGSTKIRVYRGVDVSSCGVFLGSGNERKTIKYGDKVVNVVARPASKRISLDAIIGKVYGKIEKMNLKPKEISAEIGTNISMEISPDDHEEGKLAGMKAVYDRKEERLVILGLSPQMFKEIKDSLEKILGVKIKEE